MAGRARRVLRLVDQLLAGRRSVALIHLCLLSGPRTRPYHTMRGRCSLTHQSRVPAGDHVADLDLDRRIHFPAIGFGVLTRIEIPHD